ncbi:MAG: hypothetical protein R3B36_28305 [Polyangiaceae bacterium]
MKTFTSGLVAMVVLGAVACTAADEGPAPAAGVPGVTDLPPGADPGKAAPPPEPVTGVPGEDELTERYGVFVVEGGAEGAAGTRAEPMGSIQAAIDKAKANKRRVYVCGGDYAEALTIESGVSVIGGYECASKWMPGNKRARLTAPTSPAVQARGIDRPTRLDGFEIVAPDGTAESRSSIAFIAERAAALTIARVELRAGRGANGVAGTTPAPAVHTSSPHGAGHIPEVDPCALPTLNAAARASCRQLGPGGPRPGAVGGTAACSAGPQPESGGAGEGGDLYAAAQIWSLRGVGAAPELRSGAAGAEGVPGASGSLGTFSAAGFATADGARGGDGAAGAGGSGGAALHEIRWPFVDSNYRWASTGGGGGAGGCAGLAGTPGTGGGASVALIAVDSAAMTLSEVALVAADGGDGGAGSFGSAPSDGGAPGASLAAPSAQPGGRGGSAGVSGSGAGGPSVALAHTGGAPSQVRVQFTRGAGGRGVAELTSDREPKTIPASSAGPSADILPF